MDAWWASTPLEPTCRFTCPSTCSLIIIHVYKLSSLGMGRRTSCIRDEQTEAAAAHRSGHEFIHGEKSPSAQRLPSASPESRHLWRHSLKIIITALPFQAATTYVIVAFVALPTLHPAKRATRRTTATTTPISYISYGCNQARWVRVQRLHFLWDVWRGA